MDNFGEGLSGIASSIGDTLSSLFSGMGGGGGGGMDFGSMIDEFDVGDLFGAWGGLSFDTGGVVPGRIGSPQLAMVHSGETILPTHKKDAGTFGNTQQININITGDISRQTKGEIMRMLPSIASGVNQYNREKGNR